MVKIMVISIAYVETGPLTKCHRRKSGHIKVMGDSLLIHEFAYSLFIGLYSVTSDMTGYSHSYHSIKFIHCSALQRDALSDKIVF